MIGKIFQLKKDLQRLRNPKKAKAWAVFCGIKKGGYAEKTQLLGIAVPDQRKLAKKYFQDLSLADLQKLLASKIHEHKLTALLILVLQYQKAEERDKKTIVDFYLKNTKRINNWGLVDLSAPLILGDFLLDKERKVLYQLACSKNLWEKRIAILATYQFIKKNDFKATLKIAEILLSDSHDLIHKAVGWMLREIGKRDQAVEEKFLKKYGKKMPRTMLRYAVEKFDERKRKFYLSL